MRNWDAAQAPGSKPPHPGKRKRLREWNHYALRIRHYSFDLQPGTVKLDLIH